MKVIEIDGFAGAGKSTICNEVSKRIPSCVVFFGIESTREAPETLLQIVEKIMKIEKKKFICGYNMALFRRLNDLFFRYDTIRERYAKKLKQEDKIVLMERNHVTTMSYCSAVSKQFGFPSEYEMLLKLYVQNLKNGILLIPDMYIWLDVSWKKGMKRKMKLDQRIKGKGYLWNDPNFLINYRKAFFHHVSKYEKREVEKVNTQANLEESVILIADLIRNLSLAKI